MSYQQPAYYQPVRRTNGWAIASLVTALCGLTIVPVICGHVALAQIRRTGDTGYGLAIAGLIIGYLQIVLVAIVLIAVFVFSWWGLSQ